MNVALLLISHQNIASQLLHMTETLSAQTIANIQVLEIPLDASLQTKYAEAVACIGRLDTDDGLIIITDMYGSTPSNFAQCIAREHHAPVISGMNLPMLMRTNNYRNKPLAKLVEIAISGGKQGVMLNPQEDQECS